MQVLSRTCSWGKKLNHKQKKKPKKKKLMMMMNQSNGLFERVWSLCDESSYGPHVVLRETLVG
jgi:hypothetical protein